MYGQVELRDGRGGLQQADALARGVRPLKTLPAMAERLLRLASDGTLTGEEFLRQAVELLRLDPAMTVRLLIRANEGGRPLAASPAEAVGVLGAEAVRASLLSVEVVDEQLLTGDESRLVGLWRHAVAVAVATERLAGVLGPSPARDSTVACALLHDVGKLALAQSMPRSYGRVVQAVETQRGNIADFERTLLGVDHTVLGRRLAIQWGLPEALQEAIWLHRQPLEALPTTLVDRGQVALVGLADSVVRQLGIGYSGNYIHSRPVEMTAAGLGLDKRTLRSIADALVEDIGWQLDELGLSAAQEVGRYHQALRGANAALGRLSAESTAARRRAQIDTQSWELLEQFHQSVQPTAPVDQSLLEMARVLAKAAWPPSAAGPGVVVYAVDEAGGQALLVRPDMPAWKHVALRPGGRGPAGNGAELADAVIGQLFADAREVTAWLGGQRYQHVGMHCGRRWVGGVLFRQVDHPSNGEEMICQLAGALAVPLGLIQSRWQAMTLSEQLAGSSQVLAETQDAIAEAKTLRSMGQMAAGAAHELNNPLAVVSGRAQLMRERATSESERQTWQVIAEQAQRVSDIVTELMDFANPQTPRPESVAVGELVTEAIDRFLSSEHSQAKAVRFDIQEEGDLPQVWIDRAQLCDVLVELIANAATAEGRRPRVTVTAQADDLGQAVQLTVRDEGPGMDEQTLAHAWTPFFSLQRAGRRRGLGLPKAKRYVESNGGRMWITSLPGKGTTVHLNLPVAESVASREGAHYGTERSATDSGHR
jgi:signal transduction histidine kinase/HD-like signal output (HDOD) protein